MRYARILSAVAGVPWAIHPAKGEAMVRFLIAAAMADRRSPVVAFDQEDERLEHQRDLAAAEQQATADRGGIAILSLGGVISPRVADEMDISTGGGTSAEGFARKFNAAIEDPRVGGIIIDVDSPGGNVFGVPEAADSVFRARGTKPVVAVCNPFCASAAYWIASAATEIAITPSGEIGSIGVYAYHEDVSKALAEAGVTPTLIKAASSPNKAETHPAFPLAEGAVANMQASVDRYGREFIASVARGRGVTPGQVEQEFGGGRMVGAADALKAGMVDRVATLDDEIRRMMRSLTDKPKKAAAGAEQQRRRAALW